MSETKEKDKSSLGILLIGPLPPPVGGARVSFQRTIQKLEDKSGVDLRVIKTWNPDHWLGARLWRLLKVSIKALIVARNVDVISFWASDRGALALGPLLNVVSSITGTHWILRKFGGGFDITYSNLSRLTRYLVVNQVFNADLVLLQTKQLVSYFSDEFPEANIDWHANSRPLPEEVSPANSGCDKFIFLGKVKRSKGILEIIEAAKDFQNESVTIDIFGPIGGDVSREMFTQVEKVNYRGVLQPENILNELEDHDALLLPTYYEGEGYPGAILEAYSVGRPVIATDWRAISEIVNENSGILVEPKNADALSSAMNRLYHNPNYYQELSSGALEKSGKFSLDRWTEKFLDYCREATRKRDV